MLRNLFLIVVVLIQFSCVAQNTNNQTVVSSEVPPELLQKWKIDYGMLHGQKVAGLPSSPEGDYLFKNNGTYTYFSLMSDNSEGTWEYDENEKCVYIHREDGVINGIIKNITSQGFTLIPPANSVENTPLTSLTFYYVPNKN